MRAGTWADWAEASWLSNELRGKPHAALECGHLSPPGSGPLAEAGYGYCRYHGVTRIALGAEITSPGDAVDAGGTPMAVVPVRWQPVTGGAHRASTGRQAPKDTATANIAVRR